LSVTIIPPPACQQFLNLHDGGATVVFAGQIDHGTPGGDPIPVDMIKSAIESVGHKFPLGWLDGFTILLAGLILMPFDVKLKRWEPFSGYDAVTYLNHMVLGNVTHEVTQEQVDWLVAHELGHAICYRLVDQSYTDKVDTPLMSQYKNLRGLTYPDDPFLPWEKRPWEIFAEDFRVEVLGGSVGVIPRAKEAVRPALFRFFAMLDAKGPTPPIGVRDAPATPPTPAVKEPTVLKFNIHRPNEMVVNGRATTLLVPIQVGVGYIRLPAREPWEAAGARVDYNEPTGDLTIEVP
jgi:hypothetical protein